MFQDHFEFYSDAPSNELAERSTIENEFVLKAIRCFSLPPIVWFPLVFIAILLAIFTGREIGSKINEQARQPAEQAAKDLENERYAIESNSKIAVENILFGKRNKTLKEWLETQRKGQTGYEYWLNESWVNKVRIFALQDYEIVDRNNLCYTVRIHSSTKGGFPIVCLWKIYITVDGKICGVKQAEEN